MPTSIKTKFRPSTVTGKAGTVYYQLIHDRHVARINTDIRLQPDEWNAICQQTEPFSGMLLLIRRRIERDTSRVRALIHECERNNTVYSVNTIITLYKTQPNESQPPAAPPASSQSFFTFMRSRITALQDEKRNGTAANYRHTLSSLLSFTHAADLPMDQITPDLIERYEAWLKARGLKRNSTSFYMRILRAVYNRAVRQGLVSQTFPFSKVYTGTDKTRKRAVSEETIVALSQLDVSAKPRLQLAKDLFLFSYATCGMPFVDIAFLKKTDIREGYIRYERRKTGQPLQIKVQPFIAHIMQKYENPDSPYVFPVITSPDAVTSPEAVSAYKEYRNALTAYNRHLHTLSTMLTPSAPLTSYVSRHSWATIARTHGHPVSAISKALGHTSETTTQVYLASIGASVVDKMNAEILQPLQI